jgi:hypothetical protein
MNILVEIESFTYFQSISGCPRSQAVSNAIFRDKVAAANNILDGNNSSDRFTMMERARD